MRVVVAIGLTCLVVVAFAIGAASLRHAASEQKFLVTVRSPGSSTALEGSVAEVLEQSLANVPGLARMRSRSMEGVVELELWVDRLDVPLPVAQLPSEAEAPVVRRIGASATTRWWITDGRRSASELREEVDDRIVPALEKQPGVVRVEVCGAGRLRKTVTFDPNRLAALGLEAADAMSGNLEDVATVAMVPAKTDCTARRGILVTAHHAPDATPTLDLPALGPATRVVVRGDAEGPIRLIREGTTELLFPPPFDADAFIEKHRNTLVSIDGMPHVTLVLTGPDRDELERTARSLPLIPGARFIVRPAGEVPRVTIKPDRDRLAALGIPLPELDALLKLARGGVDRDGVHFELPGDDLGALQLRKVPLSNLVSTHADGSPVELLRVNRQRAYELTVFGVGHSQIPKLNLPPGVALELRDGD